MCVQDYENKKNDDYHHKIFTFLQKLNSNIRLSANRAKDWTRSSVSYAEPRYVPVVDTIPEFISMHLSLRGMWLAAAFTRRSFTISQDSNNMAWISGQFFVVKRACIFNSLNSMWSVFISVVFRLYLAKIVQWKHNLCVAFAITLVDFYNLASSSVICCWRKWDLHTRWKFCFTSHHRSFRICVSLVYFNSAPKSCILFSPRSLSYTLFFEQTSIGKVETTAC